MPSKKLPSARSLAAKAAQRALGLGLRTEGRRGGPHKDKRAPRGGKRAGVRESIRDQTDS